MATDRERWSSVLPQRVKELTLSSGGVEGDTINISELCSCLEVLRRSVEGFHDMRFERETLEGVSNASTEFLVRVLFCSSSILALFSQRSYLAAVILTPFTEDSSSPRRASACSKYASISCCLTFFLKLQSWNRLVSCFWL